MIKSPKTDRALPQSSSLPDGWHTVRFRDVAKKISNMVDRKKCDLDHFVAGEHMQTDDFRIKEWGTIDEGYLGPAFNHKFTKGQILYGSRRTYLRKVSIPHFDGICANTTFVIEPTGDDLVPDFLPFVMQSAGFNDHSIRMSKGSTNPYINWKDIAFYEFAVPEKEQQRRIATTLWAAEDCIVKGERFVAAADMAKQVLTKELFGYFSKDLSKNKKQIQKNFPRTSTYIKIGEICEVKGGLQKTQDRAPKNNPVRYLTVIHVQRNYINFDEPRYFEVTQKELDELRLLSGDVLTVEGNGNKNEVGRTAIFRGELQDCVHQNHVIRIRPNKNKLDSEFLNYYLNSSFGQNEVLKQSMSTSGLYTLSLGRVKNLEIPYPPVSEQRQIAAILTRCDETIAAARANVVAAKALKMKMINEMLGAGN